MKYAFKSQPLIFKKVASVAGSCTNNTELAWCETWVNDLYKRNIINKEWHSLLLDMIYVSP